MSYPEPLKGALLDLGVTVTAGELSKLKLYTSELDRWNHRMNLTGLGGGEMLRRLVAEPAWIGRELGISGKLADIGSGNGSPAIPFCVTRPVTEAHLVEVRVKRAAFLRQIKVVLGLECVSIHRDRFEEVAPNLQEMDWITMQAVAITEPLLRAIKQVSSSTTRIVWITARATAPVPGAERLFVPSSSTEIWVFRRDQF
jgi:16S rRNA (guanine(527)-N(7))-methyltransferase RsmG